MTHRQRNHEVFLVLLLAVVVLAGWLGSRGLNEPDEGRFGEVAREMALQKDWLIPHLNGVPHLQKPPLTYWITAVFIRLFGANEWAVRLTPALAAFGTLLFTMYIAGVLYGKGCRWKAGLVLTAMTGFVVVARIITADMLLTFCITAAVAGLVGYVHRGKKLGLGLFYLGMGLGFMAKGPLGILIPSLAAVALQVGQRRQQQPVARLYWYAGLPVALLLGLSWYLALIHRDRTLFDYFFRYELIDRVASNTHNRSKPLWFYPGALVVGLLPWTVFAIGILRDMWRRRQTLIGVNVALFVGWVVVPYIFLSMVVSKLATYLLPLMPPLAIVIARWLEHPETADRWRRPARVIPLILGLLLLVPPSLVLLPDIPLLTLHVLPLGVWIAIIGAIASLFLLARALGKGLALKPFLFWMAGTWGGVLLALAARPDALLPGSNRPVRPLANVIMQMNPAGDAPVFILGSRAHGTDFYLRRLVYRGFSASDVVLPLEGDKVERIIQDEQATVQKLSSIPAFILVKTTRYRREPALQKWRLIAEDGPWTLLASDHIKMSATP